MGLAALARCVAYRRNAASGRGPSRHRQRRRARPGWHRGTCQRSRCPLRLLWMGTGTVGPAAGSAAVAFGGGGSCSGDTNMGCAWGGGWRQEPTRPGAISARFGDTFAGGGRGAAGSQSASVKPFCRPSTCDGHAVHTPRQASETYTVKNELRRTRRAQRPLAPPWHYQRPRAAARVKAAASGSCPWQSPSASAARAAAGLR